jgi:uncharacterized protein
MMLDALIVAASALGHVCLSVLAVNVLHGVGFSPRGMKRAAASLMIALALATLGLLWLAWARSWRDWPGPVQVYAALCVFVALVAFPATTLTRWLRRTPRGVSGRSEEIDLARREGRENLIGSGPGAWWLRVPGNDAFRLAVREWEVDVPGLPPACEGLSILHLTDLHLDPNYAHRFFEAVVDEAARLLPVDLVLFTGDLIDDNRSLERVVPLLSRLRGRLGQFAILGNHDYRKDHRRAVAELAKAGFPDLEGRWTCLDLNGATIALGGSSAPWGPEPDPSEVPEADARILLSHSPDRFYRAQSWGVDLMLCGHNHGGQYRLPAIGPVLMPSLYSRRFDRGFFRRGRTLMYVSQGIAAEHPFRFNCPPEVTRFVLKAAPTEPETAISAQDDEDREAAGAALQY